MTAIIAWLGPARVAIANDAGAMLSAQSGGRLIGVGSVDISTPQEALRRTRRSRGVTRSRHATDYH